MFHNHRLLNLARVRGAEKRHGSGPFPPNHWSKKEQQASIRANFVHYWRTTLNPGKRPATTKDDANGFPWQKTTKNRTISR